MKKMIFRIAVIVSLGILITGIANAQGGAKQGPDVNRDPDMETEARHNLAVARQYFKLRKAYVASLQRCEEVLAANPGYSKIDEILYIAGKSSLNLAEGKGKQKPDQYVVHDGDKKLTLTADEFRDKARDYLSQLVNSYPQSTFRTEAEDDLKALGGAKPKESKP
jgi:outer membrane protein assembly factor BamD (BamD/ComL family)